MSPRPAAVERAIGFEPGALSGRRSDSLREPGAVTQPDAEPEQLAARLLRTVRDRSLNIIAPRRGDFGASGGSTSPPPPPHLPSDRAGITQGASQQLVRTSLMPNLTTDATGVARGAHRRADRGPTDYRHVSAGPMKHQAAEPRALRLRRPSPSSEEIVDEACAFPFRPQGRRGGSTSPWPTRSASTRPSPTDGRRHAAVDRQEERGRSCR